MRLYSISYDVDLSDQSHEALVLYLNQIGASPQLRTQWTLRSSSTAAELRNDLRSYVDAGKLTVTEVVSSAHHNAANGDTFDENVEPPAVRLRKTPSADTDAHGMDQSTSDLRGRLRRA